MKKNLFSVLTATLAIIIVATGGLMLSSLLRQAHREVTPAQLKAAAQIDILACALYACQYIRYEQDKAAALLAISEINLLSKNRKDFMDLILMAVQSFKQPGQRATILAQLGDQYAGDPAMRVKLKLIFSRAEENIAQVKVASEQAKILTALAGVYFRADWTEAGNRTLSRTLEMTRQLPEPYDRINLTLDVAEEFYHAKQAEKVTPLMDQSLATLKEIKSRDTRDMLLTKVIETSIVMRQLEKAAQLSAQLTNPFNRSDIAAKLALAYAQEDPEQQALNPKDLPGAENQARIALIESDLQAGKLEAAYQSAGKLESGPEKNRILVDIAAQYLIKSDFAKALAITRKIQSSKALDKIMAKMVGELAKNQLYAKALELIPAIRDPREKSRALARTAAAYAMSGQSAKALDFVNQAFQVISTMDSVTDQAWMGSIIISEYLQAIPQKPDRLIISQALDYTEKIRTPFYKTMALADIAKANLKADLRISEIERRLLSKIVAGLETLPLKQKPELE